ncbi:hypothetical protein BDW69DRAFT_187776 [Aspergillus filifer]
MRSSNNWEWKWPLSGLAVALLLFPTTYARGCHKDTDYNPDITKQSELDAIASSDCTTLDRLTIWSNYTGPFNLPNITNITMVKQFQGYDPFANAEITSMAFSDLLSVDYFVLRSFVNMSLNWRGWKSLIWRISFESLESVKKELSICNTVECLETINPQASMDISLPALKRVNSLNVIGTVSNLSVPELTSIAYPGVSDEAPLSDWPSTLTLQLWGKRVGVVFPKLEHVEEEMVIKENIKTLSLPSLRTRGSLLGVRSDEILDVDLPIETADDIGFIGKIKSVNLPNLETLNAINVTSDLEFDCDALVHALNDTAANMTVKRNYNVFCASQGDAGQSETDDDETDGPVVIRSSIGTAVVIAAVTAPVELL